MAIKVASATSNWSTATWETVTNTPTLHGSNNEAVTTTGIFTGTFTAPNTTNACTGVILYFAAIPTTGTSLVVTLQESTIDTAATVTFDVGDAPTGWVYARFPTPYVFTTTSANAYRFKVARSGGANFNMAEGSTATQLAFFATDDRTGVPSTDQAFIISPNHGSAITITVDGTSNTVGAGTTTTNISGTVRTLLYDLYVSDKAILAWDIAASSTLTCKGCIDIESDGELRIGTTASPVPAAYEGKLIFDAAASATPVMRIGVAGKMTLQGAPKSSTSLWKTYFSSGLGTAASPLITTTAVDWAVGDEIWVAPTSDNAANYNEGEYRFIITKNSSTSYVLSATAGGAESALANSHTSADILNISRNVSFTSNDGSSWIFYNSNTNSTANRVDIDWMRFEDGVPNIYTAANTYCSADYSVVYGNGAANGWTFTGDKNAATHTGLITIKSPTGSTTGIVLSAAGAKTLVDCFSCDMIRTGFSVVGPNNNLTRCKAIACNITGGVAQGGYLFTTGTVNCDFNACEAHCCRTKALYANGTRNTFANCLWGTKGDNDIDIDLANDVFTTMTWINSQLESTVFINNYLNLVPGSELRFQKLQGTENNHIWYTAYGTARSSGSGLTDTTVRTAGSLGLAIRPEESSNGFEWEFQIPAVGNTTVSFQGFFRKNTAFGTDDAFVELFLPGSTTADATANLSDDTETWQSAVVSAYYSSSSSSLATVKITAKTTTASAYLYADDLYSSGDTVTSYDKLPGLDIWVEGKPASIITPLFLGGISPAVWAVGTVGLTGSGTTGKMLVDTNNTVNDNQALIIAT